VSAPERIWLQGYFGESTWCDHQIHDDDVEYIRADIHEAEVARLLEALRSIANAYDDVTGGLRFVAIARAALGDDA
jgi:hypothetical protein